MNFPVIPLAFIDGLGGPEMLLILVIVLMLFGKDKLPELARGIGKSMKELKKATGNVEEEFKRALQEDEYRQNQASFTPAITSAQPVAALSAETSPADTIPASPVATDAPVPPVASEPVVASDASAPTSTDVSPAPAPALAPAPAPRKPAAPHRGRADV